MKNNPVSPAHYTDLAIPPLEYITANGDEFTWCIANVIKYVSRYKRKNGLEDLKKAKWYLEYQIGLEEKDKGDKVEDICDKCCDSFIRGSLLECRLDAVPLNNQCGHFKIRIKRGTK